MGISAVIPTRNEAFRIRKCLDSLKGWVDEIIIIDDCSTDDTVAIATKEYNARVLVRPSNKCLAAQRNIGNEMATQEWIWQMAADIVVPAETVPIIQHAIAKGNADGIEINRRDCIWGIPLYHVGNWYHLDVFKKGSVTYGGMIHETMDFKGLRVRVDDAYVLHYSLDSISVIIERHNMYTDVESKKYIGEHPEVNIKTIKKQLGFKTLKTFYKHYVKRQGYKDGVPGLAWSIVHTIEPVLFWVKVLEIIETKKK